MTRKQKPPLSDNRYRVHRSEKLYVAKLECGTVGCTWYINDSIERVVYRMPDGSEKVLFKTRLYDLQTPDQLKRLVKSQLKWGGGLYIGGKHVDLHDKVFAAYPFIDISSEAEKKLHNKCRSDQGQFRAKRQTRD